MQLFANHITVTKLRTQEKLNMMLTLVLKSALLLVLTLKAISMPIYLHPSTFEDNYYNVTAKDVGAFKFFCIQDHISSIIEQYVPIFAVSDS